MIAQTWGRATHTTDLIYKSYMLLTTNTALLQLVHYEQDASISADPSPPTDTAASRNQALTAFVQAIPAVFA